MSANYPHIFLKEIFSNCQGFTDDISLSFSSSLVSILISPNLSLLPFHNTFQSHGPLYPLTGFLFAFIFQKLFSIHTNRLDIVRYIAFLDDDFKVAHPEMPIEKKSDSPDEGKSIGVSSFLKPKLFDFFALHPVFTPISFWVIPILILLKLTASLNFSKALIPYNLRNKSTLEKVGYNIYGYPTWPKDSTLVMKYARHCHEKGRTIYTYENMDFRMSPSIYWDSDEWYSLYKIRMSVEQTINHLKTNICITERKTRNDVITKAYVFLAGIASKLTVIIAHHMNYPHQMKESFNNCL